MSHHGAAPSSLVIVNPASAGGRTGRRWPALRDALRAASVGFEVHLTGAPDEATSVTRDALRGGCDRVIVVGGDGTLNECVNGFFEGDGSPVRPQASLALLPSGTGGDFRRTARLPTDPTELATIVAAGRTRPIDLGRIVYDDPRTPARMFVNIADCGVGGEVVARVNRSSAKGGGVRGTAVFLAISVRALAGFDGRPVRLTLDGDPMVLEVQNVVIANGRCFGGGMRIAPDAELDDGVFDVVVIPAMGRVRTLVAMPSVYRGRHVSQPGVLVRQATTVRIDPLDERPLLFDIEGEQVGKAPASLTCVPQALRLVVPG